MEVYIVIRAYNLLYFRRVSNTALERYKKYRDLRKCRSNSYFDFRFANRCPSAPKWVSGGVYR
jgi:hypothetical protein